MRQLIQPGPNAARTARVDTMHHAIKAVGGAKALARLLDVKPERVSRWVGGQEPVPLDLFLEALDLIAHPYTAARHANRRSVAVLPPDDLTGSP